MSGQDSQAPLLLKDQHLGSTGKEHKAPKKTGGKGGQAWADISICSAAAVRCQPNLLEPTPHMAIGGRPGNSKSTQTSP